MQHAIIDQSNKVINVIDLEDPQNGWVPPAGCIAVQSDTASIGLDYVDGVFVDNRPVPESINIPKTLTLEDIIAVLAPDQKAALQAKLGSK